MMKKRKIWIEGSLSVMKREHNLSSIRERGILAATEECLLSAMACIKYKKDGERHLFEAGIL